ncbi:MAG: hypothetical protein RLZZ292_656, partial [Bacteroidota bacterium]
VMGQMESDVFKGGKQLGEVFSDGFNANIITGRDKYEMEREDRTANDHVFGGHKPGGLDNSTQDQKIKSGMDNITGGGRTSKNIMIQVGTLGAVTIHSASVKEAHGDIKDTVMRALTEVLNSANQIQ